MGPRDWFGYASRNACGQGDRFSGWDRWIHSGESAEKLIRKMCGLRVSESTVQRVTEDVGAAIGTALSQGEVFGEAKTWEWHKDAGGPDGRLCFDGRERVLVSKEISGAGGRGADDQRGDGLQPDPRGERSGVPVPQQGSPATGRPRYVTSMSGLGGLGAVATPARCSSGHGPGRALDRHQRRRKWVGRVPESQLSPACGHWWILDFIMPAEYLGKIAQAWHSTDTEAVKTWMEPWCHDLKHKRW